MDDERGIIYFAISNLIKDCLEFLDSLENMPQGNKIDPEDIEFIRELADRAIKLEEKYRADIEKDDLVIQRPNW